MRRSCRGPPHGPTRTLVLHRPGVGTASRPEPGQDRPNLGQSPLLMPLQPSGHYVDERAQRDRELHRILGVALVHLRFVGALVTYVSDGIGPFVDIPACVSLIA